MGNFICSKTSDATIDPNSFEVRRQSPKQMMNFEKACKYFRCKLEQKTLLLTTSRSRKTHSFIEGEIVLL